MKPPFLERYGSRIALGLVTLFAWRLISVDLHISPELQLLFPQNWLTWTPLAPVVATLVSSFGASSWWTWIEVTFTLCGWVFVYFGVRGIFYKVMSMEGPSMWVAFVIFVLLAIAIFALLVRPAFDQMAVWWKAWPKPNIPALP